jgi:3-oxoacyl-[acyl-carrier protein] reductase
LSAAFAFCAADRLRREHLSRGFFCRMSRKRRSSSFFRVVAMLAQAFAQAHDGRPGGRIVLMTSGQSLGPMPGEIAYAASKGALAAATLTLADELADRRITVNCINPGPVDTGWATPELLAAVADRLPAGRWGEADDPARLIAWLVSDQGCWITGQVLKTEGGFRR